MSILVDQKITSEFDKSAMIYFQSSAGNYALDMAMWMITEIGDVMWLVLFSIVIFVIRRTRRIGLILLLSLVAGTIGAGYLKGYVVDNPRPNLEFMGSTLPGDIGRDTFVLGTDGSFPSGHAARAAIIALILGFALSQRFPKWCYLIWIFPVLESISRVYVLQHYPMDVLGGTVFGILIAGVIGKKLKLYDIFKKSEPEL
ncbi:MAG: phosphatase PAP2 family protein [Candidatus Nitrosotenuis sp.]|uniref:Putative PAP2 superfamily protein n=1 Tax=Candidatus Nitrosotenuis uzonensis TaxID=1407055 RepID=A0A812F7G8_9ARCH|nr:putative PAP2 superfamily protein [Candidatus Nitrosotenuis uzonensis]